MIYVKCLRCGETIKADTPQETADHVCKDGVKPEVFSGQFAWPSFPEVDNGDPS